MFTICWGPRDQLFGDFFRGGGGRKLLETQKKITSQKKILLCFLLWYRRKTPGKKTCFSKKNEKKIFVYLLKEVECIHWIPDTKCFNRLLRGRSVPRGSAYSWKILASPPATQYLHPLPCICDYPAIDAGPPYRPDRGRGNRNHTGGFRDWPGGAGLALNQPPPPSPVFFDHNSALFFVE